MQKLLTNPARHLLASGLVPRICLPMVVTPGNHEYYRNYKIYHVLGMVQHTETEEHMVLYMDKHRYWARPDRMFLENVSELCSLTFWVRSTPKHKVLSHFMFCGKSTGQIRRRSATFSVHSDQSKFR